MELRHLIQRIRELSIDEQEILLGELQNGYYPKQTNKVIHELREVKFNEGYVCPHCNSKHVNRHGKYNNKQRYICKTCGKTFTDLTNTPLKGTHYPDKWFVFIETMIRGLSLREAAKVVGVTWVTLFYWRHKLLSAIKQMEVDSLDGIIEMDETYFLYSEKGNKNIKGRKPRKRGGSAIHRGISKEQVCVLVARDRNKHTVVNVTGKGRIVTKHVDKTIGRYIKENNILCTDAWRAYKTYAKEKGIDHYRLKTGESHTIKGIYHIQNINSYHSRLKLWIKRFNGVSTKYLHHYMNWFKYIDKIGREVKPEKLKNTLIEACLYEVNMTYEKLRKSKIKYS